MDIKKTTLEEMTEKRREIKVLLTGGGGGLGQSTSSKNLNKQIHTHSHKNSLWKCYCCKSSAGPREAETVFVHMGKQNRWRREVWRGRGGGWEEEEEDWRGWEEERERERDKRENMGLRERKSSPQYLWYDFITPAVTHTHTCTQTHAHTHRE